MLQNLFSIHQFRLTKWSFLVHSTTRNAPYIHPSHDSILELLRTPRGGGGGTLIFSRIRRLGLFFGLKILNLNIFFIFQKNEYFLGYYMKILWIFFWGHHKIGLV